MATHHKDGAEHVPLRSESTDNEHAAGITSQEHVSSHGLMVARAKPQKSGKLHAVLRLVVRHKIIVSVLALVILAGAVFGVPLTRYKTLGLFVKQNVTITVTDTVTSLPVGNAVVSVAGKGATTDEKGRAVLNLPVGYKVFMVTKQYYASTDQKLLVSMSSDRNAFTVRLAATGRQVPVTVKNTITGKGLQGASIAAEKSSAKTDKDGKAVIVLPTSAANYPVTITLDGYNQVTGTITVTTDTVPGNQYSLTPRGRVYFLSNASGTMDVVSTNLDGTNRKTLVAGTGKENRNSTTLMQSDDAKYLMLYAHREGKSAKLYLVDTATGKLTVMDEGDKASFDLYGWSGHYFIYKVHRSDFKAWQPKVQALKSYNADKTQIITLDETQGSGNGDYDALYNTFGDVSILPEAIVYGCAWYGPYWGNSLAGKQASLMSVKPDGSNKKAVHSFTIPANATYFPVAIYPYTKPGMLYVIAGNAYDSSNSAAVYTYSNGKLTATTSVAPQQVYSTPYTTYLPSPNGEKMLWSDARDGKNVFFVSDSTGGDKKEIGSFSEQVAYGWFGEDYVLASKKSSELYIMSVTGGQQIKVSDYHYSAYGRKY